MQLIVTTGILPQTTMVNPPCYRLSYIMLTSPRTTRGRGDHASGASRGRDTWEILPYW